MALPTVRYATHKTHVEELNKEVKFRAMLVQEEKLMLETIQLGDPEALVNLTIDVVDACTFKALKAETLPTHIVDYLYLKIYGKSKGEIINASYTCNAEIPVEKEEQVEYEDPEDPEKSIFETEKVTVLEHCGKSFNVKINLDNAYVKYPEGYESSRILMLDDKSGIKMCVPSFEKFKSIDLSGDDVIKVTDDFIYSCVESIFDGDNVMTPGADFTKEEFVEWMGGLESSALKDIEKFISGIPMIALDMEIPCPKCGKKHKLELRGLDDFFA